MCSFAGCSRIERVRKTSGFRLRKSLPPQPRSSILRGYRQATHSGIWRQRRGIVLSDADPNAIAQDLFWGAFLIAGQTWAVLNRLYVHEDIYDAVCEEPTAVAAMPMGNGLDKNNVLGPLRNNAQSILWTGW